ncbi:MAG: MFS transporter [Parafilimonas sp.]
MPKPTYQQVSKSPAGGFRELPLISRTVLMLSLVSLFTDMASEMLYPVMPLYLKEIGFSILGIGILEGFAEAVAGLSKGYFGTWSDNIGKRMPFVRLGYSLSALSKPMMALFTNAWWVFMARLVDRTGKGLRTAPRDAVLAEEATHATLARVFGFHRALDTLGAVFGPAIALVFLFFYPAQYRPLFLWAFIPGIAAIALTFFIKEHAAKPNATKKYPSFKAFYQYWLNASEDYKKLTAALLVFALFNSSDVFLLLRLKESGTEDYILISLYIIYNTVFALCAYPMGALADKYGLKKVLITGLLIFAAVYAGMAVSDNFFVFTGLFILYGIYAAATEGIAKAWITKVIHKENTATAIGTFTGFQSIASLLASSFAGFLWYRFGSAVAFLSSAGVTLLVALYLHFKTNKS